MLGNNKNHSLISDNQNQPLKKKNLFSISSVFRGYVKTIKDFFSDPITRPAPIVYIGFIGCVVVTAVLFAYSSYYKFLHDQDEFKVSLKEFAREIKERKAAYLGIMEGQAGLFLSGGQTLKAENWRNYIANVLDSTLHSGFRGFSYIEYVKQHELAAFKKKFKESQDKVPSLVLQPNAKNFAISKFLYNTSKQSNIFATLNLNEGIDLFLDNSYEEALLKAKTKRTTTGIKATLASKETLETSPNLFIVFLPVFKNNYLLSAQEDGFLGWIMGIVDFKLFIQGVIPESLGARIWDHGKIVFDSIPKGQKSFLEYKKEIEILDYTWTILLQPKGQEEYLFYKLSSYLIPVIGLLLSFSVSVVLWSQTTTRRRAQAMADKMSIDLRASEYKNRTIIENVPGAIFRSSSNLNWQMEFMSDAILEISGYSADDFTTNKKSLSDILFEEDICQVEEAVGFTPILGHTYDVEYRIRHADGRLRWVSERGRVITNNETGLPYLMGTIFDITDRKSKEADLRSLTAALQNAVEGIAFINSDFDYERVNEAYHSIFGTRDENLIGSNWFEGLLPEDQKKARRLCYDQRFEERVALQARVNKSDGSIIHIHAVFVPSVNDSEEINGYYCFVRDLTERIQKEEALAFAVEEARQANQTKSEFLATMSHELRTPLNAIIGYSEILMEEAEDESLEEMSEDLKKINTAGRHLLELINDILDVSKLEAGKMTIHLEKFDIYTVVKNIRDLMIPTVSKNNNKLILDCDDKIGDMYSDFTKVRQALFNLVSNAAKFTKDGTVTIRVKEEKVDRREFITFDIEDSGCGISREQLKKLFQPFTQADSSTTRKYGGTGLGLTITQRFCKMLEGDVKVSSEHGKGSTFTILLPRITRHDLAEKLEKEQNKKDSNQKKAI